MAMSVGAMVATGLVGHAIGSVVYLAVNRYKALPISSTQLEKIFANRKFIVKEEILSWNSHHIRWTIIQSPEGKVDGMYSEKHTWTTHRSRSACHLDLEQKVSKYYLFEPRDEYEL